MNDNWFQWFLGIVVTALGWVTKTAYGKLSQVERDLIEHRGLDAGFHGAIESRVAVVEQSTRDTVGRLDRIETKVDRLLERMQA